VSYAEAMFIKAEALFRDGQTGPAADAHNAAIIAHVEYVTGEAAPAAYVTDQASETANTISLEKIMTHKYVALFPTYEPWADWRRTDIPALTPDPRGAAAAQGGIPRRLVIPLDERVNNQNSPPSKGIADPVWWDQ
jgi:hypothetical protein